MFGVTVRGTCERLEAPSSEHPPSMQAVFLKLPVQSTGSSSVLQPGENNYSTATAKLLIAPVRMELGEPLPLNPHPRPSPSHLRVSGFLVSFSSLKSSGIHRTEANYYSALVYRGKMWTRFYLSVLKKKTCKGTNIDLKCNREIWCTIDERQMGVDVLT